MGFLRVRYPEPFSISNATRYSTARILFRGDDPADSIFVVAPGTALEVIWKANAFACTVANVIPEQPLT